MIKQLFVSLLAKVQIWVCTAGALSGRSTIKYGQVADGLMGLEYVLAIVAMATVFTLERSIDRQKGSEWIYLKIIIRIVGTYFSPKWRLSWSFMLPFVLKLLPQP